MKDNAMNLTEARHLLSITEKDDLHTLKKKYHRLMSECHPDSLGSERPEHVERAQKINEAYRILKCHPQAFAPAEERTVRRKQPVFTGEVNERAFRERKVYLYYSMEVEEAHPYYQAAKGKYLWNPKEEDFRLFLISIHELVKELLGDSEPSMEIRSRLFQYLAEQFIEPVKALRKIASPESRDKEGREIYHFTAHLKMDRKKPLPDGMILYPKAFRGNRIIVQDQKKQEYGHLSFGDDRLYFCMIPLLEEKMAKVKMQIRDGKVDLYFRLEQTAETYRIPDRNLQIAELLVKKQKL